MYFTLWCSDDVNIFSDGNACIPGADVGIILDISTSIKVPNLIKMKQFLARFVDRFDVSESGSHFGIIRFNQKAIVDFDFNKYSSNKAVKEAIHNIPDKLGWQTRTDKALRKAVSGLFTEENGDRPDRKNILFVFTDGKPTGKGRPDYESVSDVVPRLEVR